MKNIILVKTLFFSFGVAVGSQYAVSQTYPTPWPNALYIEGVIRAENEGLRTSDQTGLPTPPTNIGPKVDKELAARRVAFALLCREWNKMKPGTAPPMPLPTDQELNFPPVRHSRDIAHEQTKLAIDDFAGMDDNEKRELCIDGGVSYFWHQCYNKIEENTFEPGKPWPKAKWVMELRANPANYLCIPYGGNYFYVADGKKYCKFCFPTVRVR